MNLSKHFPLIAKLTGEHTVTDVKGFTSSWLQAAKSLFTSFSSGDIHQLQQETQELKQLAGLEEASLTSFPLVSSRPGKYSPGEVAQMSVSKVIAQIKAKGSGLLMNEAEMGFLDTVLKAVEAKDPVALKALQEAAQQVGAGPVAERKVRKARPR